AYLSAYDAFNKAHNTPTVIVGGLDFAYPSLVTQYSQTLKAQHPDIYNAVLAFVNARQEYAATFARDRNTVPGELSRAVENATQAALFHKLSPQQALTQQNAILQKAIDT